MVHVALRIRGDILSIPKPDGIEISEDKAIDYVPDSLYVFLNLLLEAPKGKIRHNDIYLLNDRHFDTVSS